MPHFSAAWWHSPGVFPLVINRNKHFRSVKRRYLTWNLSCILSIPLPVFPPAGSLIPCQTLSVSNTSNTTSRPWPPSPSLPLPVFLPPPTSLLPSIPLFRHALIRLVTRYKAQSSWTTLLTSCFVIQVKWWTVVERVSLSQNVLYLYTPDWTVHKIRWLKVSIFRFLTYLLQFTG